MYLDMYLEAPGPGVPDLPLDEMSEQDLRNMMAYVYAALYEGRQRGMDQPVLDTLTQWYDEVFVALAEASERFRDRFTKGLVYQPNGMGHRSKYLALVRKASES